MKRILCFGDSNTYGLCKDEHGNRSRLENRWPNLLKQQLKDEYEVIEEGLCSRTLFTPDEVRPFSVGFNYLEPCLLSHDTVDVVILMLGTNELKQTQNNSPKDVFSMEKRYIDFITNFNSKIDGSFPRLIVCGIPNIDEKLNAKRDDLYKGGSKKAKKVNEMLCKYCQSSHLDYVEALDLDLQDDGLHLSENGHKTLAERLLNILK